MVILKQTIAQMKRGNICRHTRRYIDIQYYNLLSFGVSIVYVIYVQYILFYRLNLAILLVDIVYLMTKSNKIEKFIFCVISPLRISILPLSTI
jgi:hypothetical protein